MAENDDNLALRLLREIRSEQASQRSTLDRLSDRVAAPEARIQTLEKS